MTPPFVCVLKSGGRYTPDHVLELAAHIRRFHDSFRLICLSDVEVVGRDIETVPLRHGLKGWFSKLEIFALHEPRFLYLDLDTLVTGPVDIHLGPGLFVLRDFDVGAVNSSVMYVEGDFKYVLDAFLEAPEAFTREYAVPEKWGDQDFIRDKAHITGFFQDLMPGFALSWKRDLNYQLGRITKPPAILVFHGQPKPGDLNIGFEADGTLYVRSLRYLPKYLFKRFAGKAGYP